ncbi:hypothetical protein [Pedobacter cryoconitis]|uniref:hypothetical protein n=1 Tax=Pedobacter cryoconitis TaxID=188932 RepID=UPI00161F2441|nr:hypothetical protein [Pedobacter cryoconitis]MBB5644878.1 hypothetical protein [Pedobacter cryoconitis]
MKKLLIALTILSTSYVVNAQTSNRKASVILIVKLHSGKDKITKNLFVNSNDIESMVFVPAPEIKKYSPDANVALIMTPKSYVTLLTLSEFYNVRNIEKKYRNRINVDGTAIADTTNFLIYDQGVKSVVKKDDGVEILLKH